jgi:type VI secretion system secreted protein VgrG
MVLADPPSLASPVDFQARLTAEPAAKGLLLYGLSGAERLSEIYRWQLELISEDGEIAPAQKIGQPLGVELQLQNGNKRYWHGYVQRFGRAGRKGRFHRYEATLVPWFALLDLSRDCRIFQDKTVVQIVREVLADHPGLARIEERLTERYTPWPYCVQYRESDFAFISRLLEIEGIYYHFEHHADRHVMVLNDDAAVSSAFEGYAHIPFETEFEGRRSDREHIHRWQSHEQLRPTALALSDYDFERPAVELQQSHDQVRSHSKPHDEVFDYPGTYQKEADGQHFARVRLQALQSHYQSYEGHTHTVAGLCCGHQFALSGHPHSAYNQPYLLTATDISLMHADYEGLDERTEPGQSTRLQCRFTAVDLRMPYRAPHSTPKPYIAGPQTAVVVGPQGHEVHTDAYGRVKVLFHWDRRGKQQQADAEGRACTSCWLRVAYPAAGGRFGFQAVPRIGQEVLVEFLEGDPDQPLVTGVIHNAARMPSSFSGAAALPADAALSGFKSQEHHGGQYNELLFDDTPGQVRAKLSSEHGKTQLNLGYLTHPRSNGQAEPRGEGFELRTDQWGAIRAAKGLLLTTAGQAQAVGGALDREEIIACLKQALELAQSLTTHAQDAQAANAADERTPSGVVLKPQELQLKHSQGLGTGANDEADNSDPSANHLLLHSPAGVAIASPKSVTQAAGQHLDAVARQNLQLTSGEQSHLHAGTGIRAYAHAGGVHLIAHQGKVLLQSQQADTVINAQQAMHLSASQQHVLIEAKQHITLVEAGGAYLKLAGGNIELGMPGSFIVKAANYQFTGPGQKSVSLPAWASSSADPPCAKAAAQQASVVIKK